MIGRDAPPDAPDLSSGCTPHVAPERAKRRRRRDSRRSHGKAKLLTLDHLDKRTAAGRRALQLVRAFETDLGGADRLSEGAKQLVQRAAVLGTYIEACEVKWLRGEPIELLDYLAATNAQRRCIETIGATTRQARAINEITRAAPSSCGEASASAMGTCRCVMAANPAVRMPARIRP